ncbi:Pentatricopeptide repeat-containing protein [Vitis vinifera]|uniref:Pentatricopeptide repeat-containing protein n=1 Tax=Vitis vinifera TaxID=29760 RepID=A0A438IM92_VITVI|nr:Pentatricopeptide repeat-containing protein [Vitis vinifera]
MFFNFKNYVGSIQSVMQEAKRLHAHLITSGLHQQENHLRKLITLYTSSSSSLHHARLLFDAVYHPSTYLYNTMFPGLRRQPNPTSRLAPAPPHVPPRPSSRHVHLPLLAQGLLRPRPPPQRPGTPLPSLEIRLRWPYIASWTTLLACYANSCSVEAARKVFDEMPERSVVSYSAMLAAYVRGNRFREALELFRELFSVKIEPSDSCVMSVLCACANLGALDVGRWVYSFVCHSKGDYVDSRIATALIDMFFKCGSIEHALLVFEGAKEKHVGEWTAMLSGLAMHGLGEQLIEAFEKMVDSGIKPDEVTFVALLSGCSHSGLVNEGLYYFDRMESDFGVEPTVEHFGCVVDLLGRAGLIDQAMQLISEMPFEPNAAIWGALLNACRVYKNVEVGELAAQWLIKDEPWNGALYMTLLSLYREAGRWMRWRR